MPLLMPDLLLQAYAAGVFPMADSADSSELRWFDPPLRGVLPLDGFHVPKRLRKTVRHGPYTVRVDTAFQDVIQSCAESTNDRPNTWINGEIVEAYSTLHRLGFAHCVETWEEGRLVGGLYGVSLGGAFFGESMFSRATDASKVALVHLVARLKAGGYQVLDTQFVTRHLSQFGAIEVPRAEYKRRLAEAITRKAQFHCADDEGALVEAFLQSMTQTS